MQLSGMPTAQEGSRAREDGTPQVVALALVQVPVQALGGWSTLPLPAPPAPARARALRRLPAHESGQWHTKDQIILQYKAKLMPL